MAEIAMADTAFTREQNTKDVGLQTGPTQMHPARGIVTAWPGHLARCAKRIEPGPPPNHDGGGFADAFRRGSTLDTVE